MMDKRVKTALMVFLLISFPLAISWAQKQSSADADSVAIKQVVASWSDAFNRHDPHAVAMLFSEDGDFTNPQGLHRHGRKEIEDRFASTLTGPFKGAHRTDSVRSIRYLTPEIASVDIDWEMTGAKAADGSDIPLRKGLLEPVMTKQNGHWEMTVFHESEFVVAPTK